MDELKLKLLGWISNHGAKTPKSNLTKCEQQGKKWLQEKIDAKTLFISKADKGGAILVMNFIDVEETVKNEILNENNFEEITTTADTHLTTVRNKINSTAIDLQQNQKISMDDKTLITGLSPKNKAKLAPEYKAVSPYTYPSYKVHKLSKEEIEEKKVPPARLIHASKFSPLYRMEKWCSPYLTKWSRDYCKTEFILDTKHLLNMVNELNDNNYLTDASFNLFTIDVAKLYPSIQPHLAEEAIADMLSGLNEENTDTAEAIRRFVKLSLDESYVTYKERVFKPKIGIPTGGSLSRQIADVFLHWVLFKKIDTSIMNTNELRFWKRFIDDGFGIWKGTKRTFINFLTKLNNETNRYGIHFPIEEAQFGKTIHFLDVTLYIDENNTIHYKSYTKPTDSKQYLRPQSFHPKTVFESVPYSQMIRTLERNSTEENKTAEMETLKKNLEKSGYDRIELQNIEARAVEQANQEAVANRKDTLTFPVFYFDGLGELKKMISNSKRELQQLIGDTKIVMAVKKNPSIGSRYMKNKFLSTELIEHINQKCNTTNCEQCPLVNTSNSVTVNNSRIPIPKTLNCKSRNVIYLWQCILCENEDSYFGRTVQKSHKRTNTHRGCFRNPTNWEDSALSLHASNVHGDNINLNNFRISLIKQCSPQRIRREEFKYIDRYKTRTFGINRYKS